MRINMSIESDFKYICEQRKRYPQLSHASNIISKYNSGKLTPNQTTTLDLLIPEYFKYLKGILAIKTYDRESVFQKVKLLNDYYNFMHDNKLEDVFSAQGKFRPTILEEFLFILFKDFVDDIETKYDTKHTHVLGSGPVKAYSNIYLKAKDLDDFINYPKIGVNEKDQDYAIYCAFDISVNNSAPIKINIPAVAIEAKTYIDKTMLDSIIATAEKLKNGNPHTRFIAVSERYDVKFSVDPSYSRIDQIYILRKGMRKNEWRDIVPEVVWRLFDETISHLERPWSDIKTKLDNEGVII